MTAGCVANVTIARYFVEFETGHTGGGIASFPALSFARQYCEMIASVPLHLQFLRQPNEEAAAHSELWCEHPNSRSIPDLVDGVEHVHDGELRGDRL